MCCSTGETWWLTNGFLRTPFFTHTRGTVYFWIVIIFETCEDLFMTTCREAALKEMILACFCWGLAFRTVTVPQLWPGNPWRKKKTLPSGYGLLGKIRGKAGAQAWEMGRCLAFLAEPLGTPNTLTCLDTVFRGAICLRAIKKFRMSHHPWPVAIMWQLIWILGSRSPVDPNGAIS